MKRQASRAIARTDFVGILEAVYQVEQPQDAWLRGILSAALPSLDFGGGAGAVLYDLAAGPRVKLVALEGFGVPPGWKEVGVATHEDPAIAETIHANYSAWPLCDTWRKYLNRSAPHIRTLLFTASEAAGIRDQVFLNAREPSGMGCCINFFSPDLLTLAPARRATLSRIATHLAAAHRLQRRLSALPPAPPSTVDAVLDPEGRVAHAEPAAQSASAREQLGEAVRLREWARGRTRVTDPAGAVEAWKSLVTGRWTLVDELESDGKRYVLARENAPAARRLADLSDRERQVTALAALGRSNKLIAYELGLSHSTVRVLVARAAAKLGVRSRSGLIERYHRQQVASDALPPHSGGDS